jgi:hypothetical protein
MKKILYILVFAVLFSFDSYAQEEVKDENTKEKTEVKKKKDKPVRNPWNSGVLMNARTSVVPNKGALRFDLAHNFGPMSNKQSDLFGIYAPAANVRMGLSYVVIENLQVGAGITRNRMTTDLNAKYTVFEQTRKNTMPVSVTLFGNIGIYGDEEARYGTEYTFTDRLSYFGQLIVGRKINKYVSMQLAASFSHINSMPHGFNHDVISAHAGVKARINATTSFIANYDMPLKIHGIKQYEDFDVAKPTLQVGIELITTTHAFQIYVGNAHEILPQNSLMFQQNKFDLDGFRFGFVLTKL